MKLVAINTIGLTGAEIIAAELARLPGILMLPGQNFITVGTHCYRPHHFEGLSAEQVFDRLYKHQFTRSGHCWAGLTKSMTPEMLAGYDRERHRLAFVGRARVGESALDHFCNYTLAFAEVTGRPTANDEYFGFFGHNIIVNSAHYPDFLEKAVVVDFTNTLDFWLANIGQRMVWENLVAMRFWLVSMLVVRQWAKRHPAHYTSVDIREYAQDRAAVSEKFRCFLHLEGEASAQVPDGFIRFSPELVARLERDAADLRRIYEGRAEFDLGMTFDDWADAFLAEPGVSALLERYCAFWNSSSHTNLDWIGPIETEIIERLLAFTGATSRRSLSRWFYHECFHLRSDNWEHPTGNLEHYLGCLEEEIVLPEMAYYVRIALCYFERVAENTVKRAYSALPIRETDLYRRVMNCRKHFARWALEEKIAEVERRIDAANEAIAKFC